MTDKITDAQIIAIRDDYLPNQGEPFDCIAFARAILRAAGQSDVIASVERLTAQPVKTLREVREEGHQFCWLWCSISDNEWDWWPQNVSSLPGKYDDRPAIANIPPQPMPSTPEQEDESP